MRLSNMACNKVIFLMFMDACSNMAHKTLVHLFEFNKKKMIPNYDSINTMGNKQQVYKYYITQKSSHGLGFQAFFLCNT
jgi:hypothetical protein